jgi:transcription initiation factor TFIIB
MKILDQAIKLRLTIGRDPAGIAAAVIYIATRLTDEQRTQGEIVKQAHVTEVTIRNRYKEMIRKINFETKL